MILHKYCFRIKRGTTSTSEKNPFLLPLQVPRLGPEHGVRAYRPPSQPFSESAAALAAVPESSDEFCTVHHQHQWPATGPVHKVGFS